MGARRWAGVRVRPARSRWPGFGGSLSPRAELFGHVCGAGISDEFEVTAWRVEYHAHFIPESAPKPIRVWLQVGEHDNGYQREETSYHNWVMANERMAAGLKAKGYRYHYVFL